MVEKKQWRIRLMRCANIKKASQDEQQNQTTATTKNNYTKNFISVLKTKLNNKVKIPSDKTDIKQNNLPRKDKGVVNKKAW